MPRLTNLRRVNDHQGQAMCADFTARDGRPGSVCVPLIEYERYGEAALEREAEFVVRDLRARDHYVPAAFDRFQELP